MGRKSNEQKAAEAAAAAAGGDVGTATEEAPKRFEFKPYTGKESLPPYKALDKGAPDKGIIPRIKYGEPRFICARGERGTYKILAFYASPRGVMRKLWAVIKPTPKRPQDRMVFEKLKKAGIPGAF